MSDTVSSLVIHLSCQKAETITLPVDQIAFIERHRPAYQHFAEYEAEAEWLDEHCYPSFRFVFMKPGDDESGYWKGEEALKCVSTM